MGVPGFFGWLIKNYKEKKFIVKELPNKAKVLYIDSNCLFHPQCFKILDHFPNVTDSEKLENYMFKRIMNYINYLVGYVDPEIVYISVDGVAPLAKISQQRKRRFKSIEDNLAREAIKTKYKKDFNNSWSNVKITPGTKFMENLHVKLDTMFKQKSKEANNKVKYIYSSYHTPGEGEHKILNDIRYRTKHTENKDDIYVIYGLDADLFFLSLASQKENIYLLRESSHLDNKTNNHELFDPVDDVAEDLKFVSIDLTKECYNIQINKIINKKIASSDNKELKTENVNFINDFIFLCYLLGNDFLPHLPSIDIKKNGLDFLLDCYSETFINTNGLNLIFLKDRHYKINYIVLTELLRLCSLKESFYFSKILPEHLESVLKRKCPSDDDYQKEIWDLDNLRNIHIDDVIKLGVGKPEEWKFRYYSHYFKDVTFDNIRDDNCKNLIKDLCYNYFEGLEWVTKYYFEGCKSWQWQYKWTHSPFVSDLYFYLKHNFVQIKFSKDEPLNPCVQLLSVLPPSCYKELPKKYQKLVTSKDSPIIDMFPEPKYIEVDYIYKEQLFQCIPMIPYLDVDRIKEECAKYKLNKDEDKLNKQFDDIKY
jgi:5'-3' exonuclease